MILLEPPQSHFKSIHEDDDLLLPRQSADPCGEMRTRLQKAPARSISFSAKATVRYIPNRKRFTQREIRQLWMSKEDYRRTRVEAKRTQEFIDTFETNKDPTEKQMPENSPLCSLGVHSSLQTLDRRLNRSISLDAVLVEQGIQLSEGYRCEDLLSMAYMEYTEESQNQAYVSALRLATELCGTDLSEMTSD